MTSQGSSSEPVCLIPPVQVMDINPKDTVLTLTSGGCNALNLLLHGAGEVSHTEQSYVMAMQAAAVFQSVMIPPALVPTPGWAASCFQQSPASVLFTCRSCQ
jgi:hypothetical protein